jgi:hypothetical protein
MTAGHRPGSVLPTFGERLEPSALLPRWLTPADPRSTPRQGCGKRSSSGGQIRSLHEPGSNAAAPNGGAMSTKLEVGASDRHCVGQGILPGSIVDCLRAPTIQLYPQKVGRRAAHVAAGQGVSCSPAKLRAQWGAETPLSRALAHLRARNHVLSERRVHTRSTGRVDAVGSGAVRELIFRRWQDSPQRSIDGWRTSTTCRGQRHRAAAQQRIDRRGGEVRRLQGAWRPLPAAGSLSVHGALTR